MKLVKKAWRCTTGVLRHELYVRNPVLDRELYLVTYALRVALSSIKMRFYEGNYSSCLL